MKDFLINKKIWLQKEQGKIFCLTTDANGNYNIISMNDNNDPWLNIIGNIQNNNSNTDLPEFDLCVCDRTLSILQKRDRLKHILIVSRNFADHFIHMQENIMQSIPGINRHYDHIIEVNEYTDPSGKVIIPLEEYEINDVLRTVFSSGKAQIEIILANSYKNPVHEKAIKNVLLTAGFRLAAASHDLLRL